MTLTRRGRYALALAITAAVTIAPNAPDLPNAPTCHTVDLTEDTAGDGATERQASELLAAGWFADPTDHAERLYAPECIR